MRGALGPADRGDCRGSHHGRSMGDGSGGRDDGSSSRGGTGRRDGGSGSRGGTGSRGTGTRDGSPHGRSGGRGRVQGRRRCFRQDGYSRQPGQWRQHGQEVPGCIPPGTFLRGGIPLYFRERIQECNGRTFVHLFRGCGHGGLQQCAADAPVRDSCQRRAGRRGADRGNDQLF